MGIYRARSSGVTLIELIVALMLTSVAILGISQVLSGYFKDSAKVDAHERAFAEIMIPLYALRRELKVAHRVTIAGNVLTLDFQDHDGPSLTIGRSTYTYNPSDHGLKRQTLQLVPPGPLNEETYFGLSDLRWCVDVDATACPLATPRPDHSYKRVIVEIDYLSSNTIRGGTESLAFITDLENLPFDARGVNQISLLRGAP